LKRKDLKVKNVLFSGKDIDKPLNRIVHEIIEKVDDIEKIAIVGIRTRGVYLAERIVKKIKEFENVDVPFGTLDITLYRDDFFKSLEAPAVGSSELGFKMEEYQVILVDDVLFTGRTIRAAFDALMDYGRPLSIKLAILIDRGHRELPIQPDFVGKVVQTDKDDEAVAVFLKEIDDKDKIVLVEK